MIRALVLLLAVLMVVRFAYWLTGRIRDWMGHGKRLHSYVENGDLSESTTTQVRLIDSLEARRKFQEQYTGEKVPRLTSEQLQEVVRAREAERERFLDRLRIGSYQVILIFFIASILGLILEESWMYATAGLTESRVGLVWGPFSPIYGVGAALLTLITFAMRQRHAPLWAVFLVSLVVGGCLEQFAGWAMDTLFNAQSWDYSEVPGAITQWVSAPFLVFWGILGTIWYVAVMPELLYRLGVPTTRRQVVVIAVLAAYLTADIFMTFACFDRNAERHEGIPPQNAFEQWIDTHYTDKWIEDRFQNLTIAS